MFSICRERASAHRYTIHDISVLQSQFPKIALSLSYQDSVELRRMLLSGELYGAFFLPRHTEGIAGFERWDFRIIFMHRFFRRIRSVSVLLSACGIFPSAAAAHRHG